MKKVLLASLLSCLAILSVRADLIWYESFNYANGNLTNVSSGVWFNFSGSGLSDMFVNNQKLEVASSGAGSLGRADDDARWLATTAGSWYTNASQVLYASFTINCTNLPNAAGTYFASFYNPMTGTPGGFWCRVYAQTNGTTLPNSWRLGISGRTTAVSKVYPVDLATNTEYQVVIQWDPVTLYAGTIWVNPISPSDSSVTSGDAVTPPTTPVNSFSFRQASSFGSPLFVITNLAVATTFDDAATNVWKTNAFAPLIVYQPKSGTNFIGVNTNLAALAVGQGLGNLTYQWQKNGADVVNPNGNSNAFSIVNGQVGDSGSYQLIATTPYGLSATSSVAFLWITNAPVPPTIGQQPANTAVYYGQTATLYCGATGPDTLSYAWYHNNNTVASEGNVNVTGDGTPTLSIANVQTGNSTLGTYRCDVSNIYGTTVSSNAVVSASAVPAVTIDYLRGQVDPTFYLPTNNTAVWSITGVVTVYTNLTAAANGASIMVQDATAGISVYGPGHAADRPEVGDSITAIGTLGHFNSMLQLNINPADPSNGLITNSHNNTLPTPYVLPLTFTNGIGYGGVSNVVHKYVSSRVTLANVGFVNAGGTFGTGQLTEVVTNTSGDTFRVFFNPAVTPVVTGQPIPTGAVNITAPMSYFLGATAPDRSGGFEIVPTRYEDITTAAAPASPVTISNITATAINYGGGSGTQFVLLESSDVTQSLGSWARAQTNSVTPGSFPISTAGTGLFYRIKSE